MAFQPRLSPVRCGAFGQIEPVVMCGSGCVVCATKADGAGSIGAIQRMESLSASATSLVSLRRALTLSVQSPGMGMSTAEAM
jgi:hypothetical protein